MFKSEVQCVAWWYPGQKRKVAFCRMIIAGCTYVSAWMGIGVYAGVHDGSTSDLGV